MLQILATKPSSAKENMEMDELLLNSIADSLDPILHFYEWKSPAFTYGYFTSIEKHLNLSEVEKRKIEIAKRPTGGGIVYHGSDMAFSFLLPSSNKYFSSDSLENYRFVNEIVKNALLEFFYAESLQLFSNKPGLSEEPVPFCMAKPTKYDIIVDGKKVAGAAQRKKKTGYLHQGTISLAKPSEDFLSATLLSEKKVRDAILSYSYAPLQGNWTEKDLNDLRYKLRLLLMQHFRAALDHS